MVGLDSRARASCCAACTLFNRKHQDPSPGPGPRARGEGVAGCRQAGRQAGKRGGEEKEEEEGLTFFQSKSGDGGTTCGAMADLILSAWNVEIGAKREHGAEGRRGCSSCTRSGAKLTRIVLQSEGPREISLLCFEWQGL